MHLRMLTLMQKGGRDSWMASVMSFQCSYWWSIAPLSWSLWTRPGSWKGSTSRWKTARERAAITTLVLTTSLALLMKDTPSMEGVTMGTMEAMTATTMEAMDIAMIAKRATATTTREDTLTTLEDTVDMTATVIATL